MEPIGPKKGVQKQQVEKKCNVLTPTKENNSEIMINDLDTNGKVSNGPKDSKPDNDSDRNVPTAVSENDEKENARKLAAFVRKVLHNNDISGEKMECEWPICLLMETQQSVKISQQEVQNIIIHKAAEVMATHYTKQMADISVCKEQQRSYDTKYKELLKRLDTLSSELELLNRVPDNIVHHVRNVGTSIIKKDKK